ncbi:MAG: isoleucine--tRNA ligase [Candidatus Omnitrophota bacterium]|nr:isoleucine--tRNA ligase [Candidatus Omnitrophota bacterium]
MDYRKTLNLPQTEFPMKAGLAQKEPQILSEWEQQDLYQLMGEKGKGRPKYVLHDGPPYANGDIHLGHALNKTLKDIIVRYKTMQGFDSPYVPGWDCHGLPVEHQLLKELKINKSQIGQVEFRKKAHDYAIKYVGIQKEEFKRLGCFGDWKNPYLTLNHEYEFGIVNSFAELVKKGFIYRGFKPVNWCFRCETALAEAEVEYENHTSPSVYVKFKVKNPEALSGLPKKDLFLVIWTTTPWTLLANVAVAAHAEFTYAFFAMGEEILIMEKNLGQQALEKAKIKDYKILKEVKGKDLDGLTYAHPFAAGDNCRVVLVDYVAPDEGTGLVHTAPGHGQDDYHTGIKYNLSVLMPVDGKGNFDKSVPEFAGQNVFTANENIITGLKEKGVLLHAENISHSYPHCWRCKNPVIFRATEQWFMAIDHNHLREDLIRVIKEDIKWIPPAGEERILGMVSTRPDWCLSRQRYWGVPIPAIQCVLCEKWILDEKIVRNFAQIVLKEGTDSWFAKDIAEILPKGFKCPSCGKSEFKKGTDILDVWFDSGVSHQSVLKNNPDMKLPCDLYLEGSDQHRGWFQASLIPSMAIDGRPPFTGVLTHGFVVDGEGKKMSKSMGNVISPLDVMKDSGADILRLWVAGSDYREDIRISKQILDRLIEAYRKIRNTIRFLLANNFDFNPENNLVAYADLLEIDKWALHKLEQAIKAVNESFAQFDFSSAYRKIYSFCNEDLSAVYLDILKDRLYTFPADSKERRAAQTVLHYCLNALVRLLAPIIPFTAEEVFKYLPKAQKDKPVESVHLLDWPKENKEWDNPAIEEKFSTLVLLRPFVLKALEDFRGSGKIGSSLEAKVILEITDQKKFTYLQNNHEELTAFFIVSQVEIKKVSKLNKESPGAEFADLAIIIENAVGTKCSRCWNFSESVGKDSMHPTLCARCLKAIS